MRRLISRTSIAISRRPASSAALTAMAVPQPRRHGGGGAQLRFYSTTNTTRVGGASAAVPSENDVLMESGDNTRVDEVIDDAAVGTNEVRVDDFLTTEEGDAYNDDNEDDSIMGNVADVEPLAPRTPSNTNINNGSIADADDTADDGDDLLWVEDEDSLYAQTTSAAGASSSQDPSGGSDGWLEDTILGAGAAAATVTAAAASIPSKRPADGGVAPPVPRGVPSTSGGGHKSTTMTGIPKQSGAGRGKRLL
eukprot:PhM_4_TR14851/c0_g1_i1/m.26152